ncbi:tail connector protein [Shewanella phage Thanatos-2]|nr:tail connector protein [Shewanella phage Thanatos-2]
MAEFEKMATMGQTYVETQIMSENNSVAYKFDVAAGLVNSSPAAYHVKLNDVAFGDQTAFTGYCLIEFSGKTLVSRRIFTITAIESPGNVSLIAALNSLSQNNYILLTNNRTYTSPLLRTKLEQLGSVLYPKEWMNQYEFGYVCFISGKDRKVAMEDISLNDGKLRGDIRARLEMVYDKANDMGAQGYSERAVDDEEEYSTTTLQDFKQYPTNASSVPIADYQIEPGKTMKLSVDLFGDSALYANNQSVRVNLRWFNGTTYLEGTTIMASMTDKDKWASYSRFVQVPATTTSFTIIVSRVGTGPGKAAVRNMQFIEVSRGLEPMTQNAAIGVNGIRMNQAIESGGLILKLPDTKSDMSGDIIASEFREYND